MPAAGGLARRITEGPAVDKQPAWSPDGARLAFVSERGGIGHVWIQAIANGMVSGNPLQLTSGPDQDYFPSWSPDGGSLAFLRRTASGYGAWIAPTAGGAPRLLLAPAGCVRWDRARGRLIVAVPGAGGAVALRAIDPRSGSATSIPQVALDPYTELVPFDVSPDGRSIATQEEETHGDVWVLESHDGLLPRR
jgi:dipeptidyl aminopeptidase/acylaminoacyl peptidase